MHKDKPDKVKDYIMEEAVMEVFEIQVVLEMFSSHQIKAQISSLIGVLLFSMLYLFSIML